MAVVLVKSCCKPCEWAVDSCNSCGEGCLRCVAEVCRACGGVCDGCCRVCGNTCTKCCGCCSEGCDGLMAWTDSFCSEPFAGCVVFAVLINFATFLAALYYVSKYFNNTSDKPLHVWVLVALVLFLINTAFGIYLFMRLSKSISAMNNQDQPLTRIKNKWNKTWQFFMYDPVVAFYILVYLFCVAWGILGLIWALEAGPLCAPELIAMTRGGAITLLVFVGVSFMCLVCGVFSGWCNEILEGCNCFKCLCFCIYYPCCYEADRKREARRRDQRGHPEQKENVAPVVIVGSPRQTVSNASPSAPYAQAYVAPSYPQPSAVPYATPIVAQPAYMQPHQQPYQLQSQYQAPPIANAVRQQHQGDTEEGERLHLLGSRT